MKIHYSLDDIALVPADFSDVKSRKDVDTTQELCGYKLQTAVIASNMDSVYSPTLAHEAARNGAISCVHRFCTIDENVKLFLDGIYEDIKPWVSIGVGPKELERAEALIQAGADVVVLDLANGACQAAVDQYKALRSLFKVKIVVGNFSTAGQVNEFVKRADSKPDAIKVGQGVGSACVTSTRTGIAYPAVSCIEETVSTGIPVIYDGGIKDSGDLCKVIALGAHAAMVGRLFAQCEESGAKTLVKYNEDTYYTEEELGFFNLDGKNKPRFKLYRGSAAKSSYVDQGKVSSFRAPEGEEYLVPITGKVEDLILLLNGGLRSSCSYLGVKDLLSFAQRANIIVISNTSITQTKAFGKTVS